MATGESASSEEELKQILKQTADELMKPRRVHFDTRQVVALYPDEIWAIDLADMGHTNAELKANRGNRYVLVVVDVFSRAAAAEPLEKKTAAAVLAAFKRVVEKNDGRTPDLVWADQGAEFVNRQMKSYLKEIGASIYHTYGPNKVSIAERFIRTLKGLVRKAALENNTLEWSGDLLTKALKTYNHTHHRRDGVLQKETPAQVYAVPTAPEEKKRLRELWRSPGDVSDAAAATLPAQARPKFKAGDRVRVSRLKTLFEKESDTNWSREVFKIAQVLLTDPWTYRLVDWREEPIEGSFYEEELQKTATPTDVHLVEKVLKTRTRRVAGKPVREGLFRWLGYGPSADSWEPMN